VGTAIHPPEELTMTARFTRRTTAPHTRLAAFGSVGGCFWCGDPFRDVGRCGDCGGCRCWGWFRRCGWCCARLGGEGRCVGLGYA
ncbi:hypothetical protein AB0I50_55085, partial [Streptomyces prunicolor]